jgi:hypothetical protein
MTMLERRRRLDVRAGGRPRDGAEFEEVAGDVDALGVALRAA